MFKGKLWKEGRYWLIEVPQLDLSTFGSTKEDAFEMIVDAVEGQIDKKGFKADVAPINKSEFILSGSDDKYLIALMLKRQRGKYGLSLTDMAKRLKCAVNGYAQYEQGKSLPSISKIEEFLHAMKSDVMINVEVISGDAVSAA